MPAALATNLHEGYRSEYLAQYAFSSFGAAVAVPHAEDCGLDLHCTLTERVGQRSWARDLFAVQVKSESNPWCFKTADEVRWLVKSPIPVFLCHVEKKGLRLRVYNTFPRFQWWTLEKDATGPLSLHLDEAVRPEMAVGIGENQSLGPPIMDFEIEELADSDVHQRLWKILAHWIAKDRQNISRIQAGRRSYARPHPYETNEVPAGGDVTTSLTRYSEANFAAMKSEAQSLLEELGVQCRSRNDLLGATTCAMLLRHLDSSEWNGGHLVPVLMELNARLPTNERYLFAGIDRLNLELDSKLQAGVQ